MGRAPCCDKAKVKRGPWSPEEDSTLKDYIQKHGTGGNWIALPHKAGLRRCGKSCRLRWLNYLRPDIKLGGFTEEEDNIILTLYITIGSRWSVIATHLPGRTDNDVKNHWNTKLKKKLAPQSATTSNTTTSNTTTTTTTNCSVSTTNSMHFSSTTLPPLGPKAKGNGSPMTIMDNYQQILIAPEIIPSYPIIDSSTTTSFNSTVSSSQEYPILSPFSTGNDDHYPEWPGNGSGCGGGGFPFDILNIEDFDIRQAIMEGGYLASPNHSSLGFYHSTLMN